MNESAWAALEEEKRNKLPTPPVGKSVQWFQGGDRRIVWAARVIATEVPGRVTLEVKAPGKYPEDKKGVWHVSHRLHKVPGNPTTGKCGSWDYLPGDGPPKRDYAFHEEEIEKREMNLMQQQEAANKASSKSEVGAA